MVSANVNVLNLTALKIKRFEAVFDQYSAHAQIRDNTILLLSLVKPLKLFG